jgi:hypothetical protein
MRCMSKMTSTSSLRYRSWKVYSDCVYRGVRSTCMRHRRGVIMSKPSPAGLSLGMAWVSLTESLVVAKLYILDASRIEGSSSRFVSAAATKPSCSPHHRDAVLQATYVVFCAVCAGGQTKAEGPAWRRGTGCCKALYSTSAVVDPEIWFCGENML